MKVLQTINVPKENVNDEFVTISEIYYKNNDNVNDGDTLIEIETSKSVIPIFSETNGYVFYYCKKFEEVQVGKVIIKIFDTIYRDNMIDQDDQSDKISDEQENISNHDPSKIINHQNNSTLASNSEMVFPEFSKSAIDLIRKYRFDKNLFKRYDFVTTKDVHEFRKKDALHLKKDFLIPDTKGIDLSTIRRNVNTSKNNVLIIGSGDLATNLIDTVEENHQNFCIVGLINPLLDLGEQIGKYSLVCNDESDESLATIKAEFPFLNIVIGMCYITKKARDLRKQIIDKYCKHGFLMPNVFHRKSIIEKSAVFGIGNQILANAVISSKAKIGNFNIFNTSSIISHDCIIGNNNHFSPGATIAGNVQVGENVLVGMNAAVYQGVNLGDNKFVKNLETVYPKNVQ